MPRTARHRPAPIEYKAIRSFRRNDEMISFYIRQVDGVYEVCVGTDRHSNLIHRYNKVDEVIQFLTETRQQYLDAGWSDVLAAGLLF